MSRNDEIENKRGTIRDIEVADYCLNIEKADFNVKIVPNDPFQESDEYCDRMNLIKYRLLRRTKLAGMGGVVQSTEDKPVIGTQALDTCYGILFYDRDKKEGIAGHAVPGFLIPLLAEMMQWLNGRSGTIEYLILPGFRNVDRKDYSGLKVLTDYMLNHIPRSIKMEHLRASSEVFKLDQDSLSYEFAFDTSSGDFVTTYVFFDSAEHNPRYIPPKMRA